MRQSPHLLVHPADVDEYDVGVDCFDPEVQNQYQWIGLALLLYSELLYQVLSMMLLYLFDFLQSYVKVVSTLKILVLIHVQINLGF